MAKRKSLSDMESLIADGEGRGPGGFTAQTVNGTAHYKGLGWNQDRDYWRNPPADEGGAWQEPHSNRTGE